jgi:hypothetical protein
MISRSHGTSKSFFALFAVTIYFVLQLTFPPSNKILENILAVEAAAAMTLGVPNRMLLSAKMEGAQIGRALLTALQIDSASTDESGKTNVSVVTKSPTITAETVIQSHTGKYGSICFVVRRPG